MKKYLLFIAIFYGNFAFSQLNESFNDRNFTSNPLWGGSNSGSDFSIDTNSTIQLRSASSIASNNFYLSTPNNIAQNCQWEFWVNLQFNPSGANYMDVYLTSDQANLQATSINGYFIRIGNTNDEICLYKRSGISSSSSKLIDGIDGILNTSNNKIKIRVTRSATNIFTLERDITGSETSYITEGSLMDASFVTSAYFGIFIQQSTASFHQKHFFDDFKISTLNTDIAPPKLLSTIASDSTTLEITFNESIDSVSAKSTLNYSINNNIGNPVSILTTSDASKYILKLSKGLNTASYHLTVSNIKDKAGNIITSNNTASFSYVKPFIAKKGDLVINEIFADPSPQIDLPSVEFIEIYNTINQTIKLNGWKYSDLSSIANFPADSIKAGEYLILCSKADTNEYKLLGKTIGISPWPSLNNSSDLIKLIGPQSQTIDSVAYSDTWYPTANKKLGGWSLEQINFKSLCTGLNNWTVSINNSGGTPGKENSVFIKDYDQLGLKTDSVKKLSDTTLSVYFNKPIDLSTVNNAFDLNPSSGDISAVFDNYHRQAIVQLGNKFADNTSYKLNIAQLKDCAGNVIQAFNFEFTTPKLAPVRLDTASIFITEIFADPSPEIDLPLAEFVEIYNPGKDTIDLEGWTIGNSKTKVALKKTIILPNDYLILCPASDSTHFKPFGKTSGVSPWPTLNNTSDQVVLKSFKSRLSDSVSYSDTWHSSSIKKQGGWSLERIDYRSLCSGIFNWTSSIDITGGTPGKHNAMQVENYDRTAFKADSLKQISDTSMYVYFNKPADLSTSVNAFSLQPGFGTIKSITFNSQAKKATLITINKFEPNTNYQLYITQLKDCGGNSISSTPLGFTTEKLPLVRLDTAQLYLTEFFADPSPEVQLPLAEFIEIFNPGKDTVDLDGWSLSNSKTKTLLKNTSIAPNEYLILCPLADTLSYKSFGKVNGLTSWPSLTNTYDQITLKSFKNRLVDSISYSDTWHHSSTKKQGGWSFERIDHQSICNGKFNWTSSIDISGGTPGKQNSVRINNYDKISFKADSVKRLSDSVLTVYFNKSAEISTSEKAFSLQPNAGTIHKIDFDARALRANLSLSEKFNPNTPYQLIISRLRDCAGNNITSNTALTFTTPKLPPVRIDTGILYITEIFADPSPEVKLPLAEFIELFNPGKNPIDLQGWTLSDATTKSMFKNVSILPGEYLIICPSMDTLQYKSFGKTIGISPWPSLNNASELVTLKSFKGRLIDSVLYQDSWYKDDDKKSGGWSLERIDHQSACSGAQNWVASNDLSGGTPGRENSVHQLYKNTPLKIVSANLQDSVTLSLLFNRPADSLSLSKTINYIFNNGAGNPSRISLKPDLTQADLKFSNPLARGNIYKITCSNITDCAGTFISSSNNFAEIFYPHRISKNDILINEILFNPHPGGVDFVEIYNNSKNILDLKDLSLATIKSPDSIISRKALSTTSFLLHPAKYLVLTTDPDNIKKEYPTENEDVFLKMTSMPSFNNDAGAVVLLSGESRIDQLNYNENMHFKLIKDPKGISLERSNFSSPTNQPGNFRSASASVGYATPGYKNSQSVGTTVVETNEIAFVSKTFSPDNDGFEDALQINYLFKDAGMVANVNIYNDKGMLIRRLAKNTTIASEGTLVWDGMNDDEQRCSVGIYIVYFEAFNLKGELKKYRKPCVLAAKFN